MPCGRGRCARLFPRPIELRAPKRVCLLGGRQGKVGLELDGVDKLLSAPCAAVRYAIAEREVLVCCQFVGGGTGDCRVTPNFPGAPQSLDRAIEISCIVQGYPGREGALACGRNRDRCAA